jgi:hypothetical protein
MAFALFPVGGAALVVLDVNMGWIGAWFLTSMAWGVPQGTVILAEDRFNVQKKVDLEWIYTVGPGGFSVGDELMIHDPHFHGMRWSKWGDVSPWPENCTPQSTGQEASWGLVSARVMRDDQWLDDLEIGVERSNCTTDNQRCTADIHLETSTHIYLMGEDVLQPDDEIHVFVGDAEGCTERCEASGEGDCAYCDHCGFEMPDRSFPEILWSADECLDGSECEALEPVGIEVSAATEVRSLHVVGPSQHLVGEPLRVKVALMDEGGNAVASAARRLTLELGETSATLNTEESHDMSPVDEGWHDFGLTIHEPGVYRFEVDAGGGLRGRSNPIEILAEEPDTYTWWGDIHVHHGYTWTDDEGFPQDINHVYARDVVGLDVVAESIKADGIEIDGADLWEELKSNCSETTVEGDYLVLLAFEWMGQVVADARGEETEGHHNVYYDTCDAPFGTHDIEIIDSLTGDLGLWTWLESVEVESGARAITIPHAMRFTGHNYEVSRPGLQTLAEIYSEWGDSSVPETADDDSAGSTEEMLSRGLRLGWIGASDNHDGWMGNPYSQKNKKSGLGAFLAPELSRAAIFEAMESRQTYATTGHRPILHAWMEDEQVRLNQGMEYLASAPKMAWRYHGTDALRTVTLWSISMDGETAQQALVEHEPEGALDHTGSMDIPWDGVTPTAVWIEVVQEDLEKAWSSPVWLSADCSRLEEGAVDPLSICALQEDTGSDTGDTGQPSGPDRGLRCSCRGSEAVILLPLLGILGLGRRRRIGT